MCGIFCSLSGNSHIVPNNTILERLEARGPDNTGHVLTTFPEASTVEVETYLTFYSTVLSLRGAQITTQPFQLNDQRFTLCWNGEAWSIDGHRPLGNDTEAIHRLLSDALTAESAYTPTGDACADSCVRITNALSRVAGPYAFVFFDHFRGRLYFGRDFLGRRSLLTRTSLSGDMVLSSVSDGDSKDGWSEVECDGIHYVDLNVAHLNATSSAMQFGRFQGGVIPYSSSDRQAADTSSNASVLPNLFLYRNVEPMHEPLHAQSTAVTRLEGLLRDSLSLRAKNIPPPPSLHDVNPEHLHRAKLAVLFSGGLDCTVLARLSHDLLPLSEPIDLLNVAFESPRIHKHNNADGSRTTAFELCPDRVTGRASHAELGRVCPDREWRFVAIDVPYSETQRHRDTVISLMHPHNTEMDLSIANALYFAARGIGSISTSSHGESARVLLSGLGADELFAGYTRHATAFKRSGFDGLLDELELDVSRLGKRNLGRDDRVMSHWGKEVRFPYLDENLLGWALDAPVTDKCGFGEPEATEPMSLSEDDGSMLEPEKKVLRCLAWRLGLRGVAKEKKRAIQFGARTAKMDSGRTKGTHVLS